ncbi:Gp49 family protein [Chromobacterium vaccinii]|uniref:Gp49 family protein n=1 Tax=Chromobacterium vaccinii TaxID=1108595 RepID=UPI003C70F3BF
MVKGNGIAEEYYFTAQDGVLYATGGGRLPPSDFDVLGRITLCVLILKDGSEVIGESICADPALSNPEVERATARRRALTKAFLHHGGTLTLVGRVV